MNRTICFLLAATFLSGCGGVSDNISKHQLTVQILRHGRPVPNQAIRAAIRPYPDAPSRLASTAVTDAQGHIAFEFQTMWGAAFLIIPPVGNVPPRAPKPYYLVSVAERDHTITPKTPETTYRWREGSWHTDTTLMLP